MKLHIRGMILAAVVFVIFFVVRNRNDDSVLSINRMVSYVNDNYDQLANFPYSEIEEIYSSNDDVETKRQKEEEIIQKYLGNNTIVKSIYAYDENTLQFYCGGSGFLDTGTYMGFYFSMNDTPYAFEFNHLALDEIEPGVFEGQDEKGHKIRTGKIRNNWYYYIQCWS